MKLEVLVALVSAVIVPSDPLGYNLGTRRRWPARDGPAEEGTVADGIDRLLHALIEREIVRMDQKNVQLTAGPRVSAETVDANQVIEVERERHRASELAPAFADGLRRAHAAQQAGTGDLVLDDRRADENAIADALIQFLVRPQLATSHSEQTEPNHYLYHVSIDWPRLQQLARDAGLDLDAELARV